jgi:hypothetical protein
VERRQGRGGGRGRRTLKRATDEGVHHRRGSLPGARWASRREAGEESGGSDDAMLDRDPECRLLPPV